MEPVEIRTECYSGYRADEYPKCFYLDDVRYEITDIKESWYQGEQDPQQPVRQYFRVVTSWGGEYLLRHDLKAERWYLCI